MCGHRKCDICQGIPDLRPLRIDDFKDQSLRKSDAVVVHTRNRESSSSSRLVTEQIQDILCKKFVVEDRDQPCDVEASILVDWNPIDFLNSQYEDVDHRQIASVVTLIGTTSKVQATTCEVYVKRTWPEMGLLVVEAVQKALTSKRYTLHSKCLETEISVHLRPPEKQSTLFSIKSTIARIISVAQIVAWLGAACRMSPDRSIQSVNTQFNEATNAHGFEKPTFCLEYEVEPLADEGQLCWHPLFLNPVITRGYPIQTRGPNIRGLEIPVEIMAALGGVRHAVDFEGGLVLKGFSTIFVPTERHGNSIQWHLIHCKEGNRIPFQEIRKINSRLMLDATEGLDHVSLWQTQAFLGWWKATETHLGTADAAYEDITWSKATDRERGARSAGGVFGFQSTLTGALNFNLGAKDGKLHFNLKGAYQSTIQRAERTPVVLFEPNEKDRRGCLVSALDVMVHMAQTKHRLTPYTTGTQEIALVPRDAADCRYGARNMLKANESVRLYDCNSSNENYTFKDLILDLFSLMDRLIEQNIHVESAPGIELHDPLQKTLYGFEYMALVENVSPLHMKQQKIQKTHGGWVDLVKHIDAVVLFGSGFGEILKPPNGSIGLCPRWTSLPKGKDYLAVGVPLLEELYRRAGSQDTKEYLTSTQLRWHHGPMLFEACTSAMTHECECERLQQVFPKLTLRRVSPIGPLEPNGCVIFGQDQHLIRRKPRIASKGRNIYTLPNAHLSSGRDEKHYQDESKSEEHTSDQTLSSMLYEGKSIPDPPNSNEEKEFDFAEFLNVDELNKAEKEEGRKRRTKRAHSDIVLHRKKEVPVRSQDHSDSSSSTRPRQIRRKKRQNFQRS